ncbi:hypothetical protein B0H63DRAFT_2282 [Podospora didyma]|uniref:Uncharacterized protein n=1 Tax=Podospora didyma TaxID=330526 RepID=A0AAE0P3W2_9PEZI|nr:hypothetical protein B0H63DRAFT_2282 [Podospora didyma]
MHPKIWHLHALRIRLDQNLGFRPSFFSKLWFDHSFATGIPLSCRFLCALWGMIYLQIFERQERKTTLPNSDSEISVRKSVLRVIIGLFWAAVVFPLVDWRLYSWLVRWLDGSGDAIWNWTSWNRRRAHAPIFALTVAGAQVPQLGNSIAYLVLTNRSLHGPGDNALIYVVRGSAVGLAVLSLVTACLIWARLLTAVSLPSRILPPRSTPDEPAYVLNRTPDDIVLTGYTWPRDDNNGKNDVRTLALLYNKQQENVD